MTIEHNNEAVAEEVTVEDNADVTNQDVAETSGPVTGDIEEGQEDAPAAVTSEAGDEENGNEPVAEEGDDDGLDIVINPASNEDLIRVVEAMLFAAKQPLSLNVLRERLPEGADVGGLLLELQANYEGRGVTLNNIDNLWAFRTASDLSGALQLKKDVRRPLSRAAMETLSIIAYHQPVTRAEIENIRGVVTSGGTLDILMEEDWIKPGRRRETPGRPLTWVTTTAFLDQFGLQSLSDLPGLDDLKASGLLDRRPAIDATTADMFDQIEEEDAKAGDDDENDDMATEEELAALKAEREAEEGPEEDIEEEIEETEDEPQDVAGDEEPAAMNEDEEDEE